MRAAVLIVGIDNFAHSSQDEPGRRYLKIDLVAIHAGQIDAKTNAGFATIGIDRRSPAMGRSRGKADAPQMIADFVDRTVDHTHLDCPHSFHLSAETSSRVTRGANPEKAWLKAKSPMSYLTGLFVLATSYSRTTYRRTTIGAAAFHFRVRNGNGWCHCAIITRVRCRTGGWPLRGQQADTELWR